MSGMRYTEELKREAVALIADRGHSVKSVQLCWAFAQVGSRLGEALRFNNSTA